MLIPKRFPGVGWAFAVACLVTTVCIDFSNFHARINADTIIPILVSLYKWDWFYWGQDRLGMILPAIAHPFSHPFANLLVQTGLSILGGLAAIGLFAWYLLRGPGWGVVGGGAVVLFLVTFPPHNRFDALNGAHPYLAPLALALGGILLVASGRWVGWVAGLALTGLAYWFNSGLALNVGPLVVGRLVLACFTEPGALSYPVGAGFVRRVWSAPAIRECAIALGLTGLGTVIGMAMMRLAPHTATEFTLLPVGEWRFGWGQLIEHLGERYAAYLRVIGGIACGGLVWFAIPGTRTAAVRSWLFAGVAVGSLVVQIVTCGMLVWVKNNAYDVRYMLMGMVALAPAAVAVLVGPFLAVHPVLARRAAYAAALAMPVAAVVVFGPPSVSTARAAVDRATGAWTEDIIASKSTHVGGEYAQVWLAVFHANMTLADRADSRIVWGLAFRATPTQAIWSEAPAHELRLGWLIPSGETQPLPTSALWRQWYYPDLLPVEAYPTLVIFAHRPRATGNRPLRDWMPSDWVGWPGREHRRPVKAPPAPWP